jgi:predicted TIM-barrel fold metal-dependent hydrolase
MYEGYKVIDADSHVMEPDNLWEKYIDSQFSSYAPKATLIGGNPPRFHFSMEVGGHQLGGPTPGPDLRYIPDGDGALLTYGEAYREFVDSGFSPESYMRYMEWRGLDYIILYPTTGLFATAVPGLDPKAAAAIRRAYNDWLYDFCDKGDGKLIGIGSLDLRDVDLAVQEARRCVTELGLKGLYVLPDPPIDGVPLNHSYYDPLWAEISELGVPLGIHEATGHLLNHVGAKQVKGSGISYATKAVSFGLGTMVAALVITGGGICERHPDLKVVFLEATAGWGATWFWYLDEMWERETREHQVPNAPSYYFERQCYISAEPEEPGIKYLIDAHGEDNIIYNTDFPHPGEAKMSNPADEFLALDGVSAQSKRKILWDNSAKLYNLT